jgi:hypothetical protein
MLDQHPFLLRGGVVLLITVADFGSKCSNSIWPTLQLTPGSVVEFLFRNDNNHW